MSTLEDIIAKSMSDEIDQEINHEILIEVTKNWHCEQLPEGWAGEFILNPSPKRMYRNSEYFEIMRWIKKNIHNPEKNAHWTGRSTSANIRIFIRRPQDLTAFLLRWS